MSGGAGPLAGRRIAGAHAALRVRVGGGREPALLLLHALAGSGRQWHPQAERCAAAGRRVIVPDLAGHGRSETPADGRLTLERAVEDVARVLDALAPARVVVAGHSFGAGVAACLAAERPERVAGLWLLDPIGDGASGGREMRAFIRGLAAGHPRAALRAYWEVILEGARPETRRLVLEDFEATAVEVILSALASTAAFDARATLAAYPGPRRLVTTPLNDHPTSLHRVVPELTPEQVEGTSHWVQLDAAETVSRALEEFLESVG